MTSLAGKSIVVTGAGSGLGAAYARHAAGLGAAVLVNDLDAAAADATVAAIRRAGGTALARPGSVADWDFGAALVGACLDAFGRIDGLVNNAGVLRHGRIGDIREADLRLMLDVNLIGTAACASAAARVMLEQGAGSIVNIASGSQAGDVALGGYGATKGGVAALTYAWALELAGTGVRINAVSPLAATAMAAQNAALLAEQSARREVKYGTLPDPDVNAPVVAFLLSDAAAGINGQVVRIAGRELSFVTHPTIAAPVLVGDWTDAAVAEAFAGPLAGRQHRLGLVHQEARDG